MKTSVRIKTVQDYFEVDYFTHASEGGKTCPVVSVTLMSANQSLTRGLTPAAARALADALEAAADAVDA